MYSKEIERLIARVNKESNGLKRRFKKREIRKYSKFTFIISPFIRALVFTTIVLIAYNILIS